MTSHWTDFFGQSEDTNEPHLSEYVSKLSFYHENPTLMMWPSVSVVVRSAFHGFPHVYKFNLWKTTLPLSLASILLRLGILENGNYVYVACFFPVRHQEPIMIGFDELSGVKMFLEVCTKLFLYEFKITFENHHDYAIFYPFVSVFLEADHRQQTKQRHNLPHVVFDVGSMNTCNVCFVYYSSNDNNPLILKCGCTMCQKCVQLAMEKPVGKEFPCPLCDEKTPKSNLSQFIINYSLLD